MNNIDAIEVLKAIYPSQKEIKTGEYDHVADALDDAITALEKQIPYKPTSNVKFGIGKCKCGVEFLDKDTAYCGNCGQKLDWEGKDE